MSVAAGTACDRNYVETGDLTALHQRGELRILIPRLAEPVLPRQVNLIDFERDLADSLAHSLGLKARWILVSDRNDLIESLEEGRGDIAAANLTVTSERAERIAFSWALAQVREQVVFHVDSPPVNSLEDLVGRTVVVRRSSSFWPTVVDLAEDYPGIDLAAAPEDMDTEEIMYRVARGEYDVTVADDHLVTATLTYTPTLQVGVTLTEPRDLAWGVRPGAPGLLAAVDSFLDSTTIRLTGPREFTADLPGIKQRRVLRLLTRNSAATYFIHQGELVGFEYDLAREFARRHGLQLEVVVPPTSGALLTWLKQGLGDLVAAGVTLTEERLQAGVTFSRPYFWVREIVVGRLEDSTLTDPRDLAGRTLVVRRSASYWSTLERLRDSAGVALVLEEAPEEMETEEILDRVALGEYDLTVSDDNILSIEQSWRDDLLGLFPITDSVPHAWAVRAENTELLAAVNDFFRREYRGLFYGITREKYFGNPELTGSRALERASVTGTISPFDSLIQHYAAEYQFDWTLVAAQMFEESRFDPEARSFAGAIGLMQVMPRTARAFGFPPDELTQPAVNTHAGVTYLAHVYQLIEDAATPEDRMWFALAAYNAGKGHLDDARRLARQRGLNPNIWFGHVGTVMPLLARRSIHATTRHGYCRCTEPVRYVEKIRVRQEAYRQAADTGDGLAVAD